MKVKLDNKAAKEGREVFRLYFEEEKAEVIEKWSTDLELYVTNFIVCSQDNINYLFGSGSGMWFGRKINQTTVEKIKEMDNEIASKYCSRLLEQDVYIEDIDYKKNMA